MIGQHGARGFDVARTRTYYLPMSQANSAVCALSSAVSR